MSLAIKAINLSRSFGEKTVFKDVNFEIFRGETVSLIGVNGSGKTTLLRTISKMILPSSGQVVLPSSEIIGWVPAHDKGLVPLFTGRENLYFLGSLRGISKNAVDQYIENFGHFPTLSNALSTPFYQCSLGMKQSLKIAASLLPQPTVLLWDEPFKSLDDESLEKIKKILLQMSQTKCIVIANPSVRDLHQLSVHRQFEMKQGQLLV